MTSRETPGPNSIRFALPTRLEYPIVAVGDLHGRAEALAGLLEAMGARPVWRDAAIVFLGDFVDRNEEVGRTIDLATAAIEARGGSAVAGNHDLALVGATGIDGGPPSDYWIESYRDRYDHWATFESYLGRGPGGDWTAALAELRSAMPEAHRAFLGSLPWAVEADGHLFLHNGLSEELEADAEAQAEALRAKVWSRGRTPPRAGTATDRLWRDEYPVWLGADKSLAGHPLPHPSKTQVSGHRPVSEPTGNRVRIRIDTSGGFDHLPLTACLLRGPDAAPEFLSWNGEVER